MNATTAKVFDFHAQRRVSDTPEVDAMVERAMRQHFPDLLAIHKAHVENDKRGIDYWLEFPNGKMETLDIKTRVKDYYTEANPDNVTIEIVANTTTGKPGWPIDPSKLTDWVLFLWPDTGKHDLIHARQLRAVVTDNLDAWQATKQTSTQTTRTCTGIYDSTSMFVSSRELWVAIYQRNSYKHSKSVRAGG